MKAVLIIGSEEENFCIHFKKAAARKNILPVIIRKEDVFKKFCINIHTNSGTIENYIEYQKKIIDLKNIIAVFPRFNDVDINIGNYCNGDKNYINAERNALYKGWLHLLDLPVINLIPPKFWGKEILFPPDLIGVSKKTNLSIPEFIISNNFKQLEKFFLDHDKNILYSPLTRPDLYYKIDSGEKLMKLSQIVKYMNVTLNELITGKAYKVFIAGRKTFIVNDRGNSSDTIPKNILNDCMFIAGNIKLSFVKFLIIKNERGFYLTSISLNPDFSGCSNLIAGKIIREIIKHIGK